MNIHSKSVVCTGGMESLNIFVVLMLHPTRKLRQRSKDLTSTAASRPHALWATPMMQTSTMLLPTFGFWMAASLSTQSMAVPLTFLQMWGSQSTGLSPPHQPLDFSFITRLTRQCAHSCPRPLECQSGIPPMSKRWKHFWRPK